MFTIGHSNQPADEFLGLLQMHSIEVLADVRSRPVSRFCPQFSQKRLQASLAAAGIDYVFLGRELGGRPDGEQFYDEGGRVVYERIAAQQIFRNGIERLLEIAETRRVVIMCSEEDPAKCHRRHLIAPHLVQRGIKVLHIRRNKELERERDVGTSMRATNASSSDPGFFQ